MLKWVYKHAVRSVLQVTTGHGTAHQYSSTSLCIQPHPKPVQNTVRYSASCVEFPASSFSEGHPVAIYVFSVVFPSLPSIMCFRRQFLLSV